MREGPIVAAQVDGKSKQRGHRGHTATAVCTNSPQQASSSPPLHQPRSSPALLPTAKLSTTGDPGSVQRNVERCTDKVQSPRSPRSAVASSTASEVVVSMPWFTRVDCPDCGLSVENPQYASPVKRSSPLSLKSQFRAALEQKTVVRDVRDLWM